MTNSHFDSSITTPNSLSNTIPGSEIWTRALETLKERIKPHNFEMWLQPIQCEEISGSTIQLRAPNPYIQEWFQDNYLGIVLHELRTLTNRNFEVNFAEHAAVPIPVAKVDIAAKNAGVGLPVDDFPWNYVANDRYLFNSFVVGTSNQLANAAARAVAEKPGGKYNPLFIYGGVGLGKTHLLCAIANEIRLNQPKARILYLSSEQFINEYIAALRNHRIDDFRVKYRRHCDVLLLDDIQFIAGKDRTQDEFFHTFNSLHELQRQIVLTSDKYPHEIPDLEERLRTRFQWGLIADIQHPELETRTAILKRKAETEGIVLNDEVALYLAGQIKSNVRELEGCLIRLAALASLQNADITVSLAQETLKNILAQKNTTISVERIQKDVANYFNIKISDLKSQRRNKTVSLPRQIAMYLSRELTGCSFPEIGQRFGGKDHSTVISACRKIAQLSKTESSMRSTIETLQRQFDT